MVTFLDFVAQQTDIAETPEERIKMLREITKATARVVLAVGVALALIIGVLAFAVAPHLPVWGYGVAGVSASGLAVAAGLVRTYRTLRTGRTQGLDGDLRSDRTQDDPGSQDSARER